MKGMSKDELLDMLKLHKQGWSGDRRRPESELRARVFEIALQEAGCTSEDKSPLRTEATSLIDAMDVDELKTTIREAGCIVAPALDEKALRTRALNALLLEAEGCESASHWTPESADYTTDDGDDVAGSDVVSSLPQYEHYILRWETKKLRALGDAFANVATSEALGFLTSVTLKHSLLAGVMSAIALPQAVLKAYNVVDNPVSAP